MDPTHTGQNTKTVRRGCDCCLPAVLLLLCYTRDRIAATLRWRQLQIREPALAAGITSPVKEHAKILLDVGILANGM